MAPQTTRATRLKPDVDELMVNALTVSVSLKVIAHPTTFAKFKHELTNLLAQSFASGLYAVRIKTEENEL